MSSILPKVLAEAAQKVAHLLHERGETVSFAETAAGGLLSASILATPGASKIYSGGLTLYTLPSRLAYAGWTQDDIATYRGPNAQLVAKIARNINSTLQSTYTVCESGTAGPTGGTSRERTPGFVALAVVCREGREWAREVQTGSAERERNMLAFAVEALRLLESVICERAAGERTAGAGGGESEGEKL